MSQHGCPERLSNRSKGFQEEGPSQATMEVLVETLTGTAFEMTVSPSDTIFAIKSKIFRVEGIPVSQQHLLYNLKELEDSSSLCEHAIADGARLRLVLGMRGGPISTRRLPPPAPASADTWPDIERLLDSNRDELEWSSSGCKVTVLVFRDGERVNMLRVKENNDGTYSPVDNNKYSAALASSGGGTESPTGSLQENAVTMGKMLELRRRMEALSLQRGAGEPPRTDKVEIQKTRSEETLATPRLLEEAAEPYRRAYAPYSEADDSFAPLYDRNYTRYEYECGFGSRYTLLPPIGAGDPDPEPEERTRQSRRDADEAAILEECLAADECHLRRDSPPLAARGLAPVAAQDYGPLVGAGWHAHSASALQLRAAAPHAARAPPLEDALFSSSTSDLESLKRNSRILPALSRHRPREHLHLSDEGLHLTRRDAAPGAERRDAAPCAERRDAAPGAERRRRAPPPPPRADDVQPLKEKKIRVRCGLCAKRLSIATVHRCRCGGAFCAPHRYAEVHGCLYDYKAALLAAPRLAPRKLPDI